MSCTGLPGHNAPEIFSSAIIRSEVVPMHPCSLPDVVVTAVTITVEKRYGQGLMIALPGEIFFQTLVSETLTRMNPR